MKDSSQSTAVAPSQDDKKDRLKEIIEAAEKSLDEKLQQIFDRHQSLHDEDTKRYREEFENRMAQFEQDMNAIRDRLKGDEPPPVTAIAETAPVKPAFTAAVQKVFEDQDRKVSFRDRAIANLPSKLSEQVERFSDEIRAASDVIAKEKSPSDLIAIHIADTKAMRDSWNYNIAYKAAFILYTAARTNGVTIKVGAGMFGDILDDTQDPKSVAARASDHFEWVLKSKPDTFEKMLYTQKAMIEKADNPAGFGHIVFIADNSLKLGDEAACKTVIADMAARFPNLKWDIVVMSETDGVIQKLESMLPNVRVTKMSDVNQLPSLLTNLAVTPFGAEIKATPQSVRTDNILLRHYGM